MNQQFYHLHKTMLLSVVVTLAAGFTSCSSNDALAEDAPGNRGISFRFELPQTRAAIGEDGAGSFEEGDEAGLYAYESGLHNYHQLTLQGGEWLPRLRAEELGEIRVLLTAFYPAPQTPAEPDMRYIYYEVETDQSDDGGYSRSDVLGAQYESAVGDLGAEIPMTFRHLMHRLNITVTGLDTSVPDFDIKVYGRTRGLFDLSRGGRLQAVDDAPTEWIVPRRTGEGTYAVLLAPQPVNIGSDRIRIVCSGKTYNYRFPGNEIGGSQMLESGKETEVELRFAEKGEEPVDEKYSNGKFWVWGTTMDSGPEPPLYDESDAVEAKPGEPDKFPQGRWFYYNGDVEKRQYLSWQSDYGWYDSDKMFPTGGGDANMCWAAASSNALYWWMYHNRDYIERYETAYKDEIAQRKFTRPTYQFSGKLEDDELMALFRDNCRNVSWGVGETVNWFVGAGGSLPYLNTGIQDVKGFFGHAFNVPGAGICSGYGNVNKETFNKGIKEALENGCALSFSTYYMQSGAGHIMTIWGVEFDRTGTVSHIYYADNNDYYQFEIGGVNFQRHRIIRRVVRYDGQYVYLGEGKTIIKGVDKIALRRDVWEKWEQSLN